MQTKYLQGLAAKMAKRDKRRAGTNKKVLFRPAVPVPAKHVRSTRRDRQDAHKNLMVWRREQQLARRPGFTPNIAIA